MTGQAVGPVGANIPSFDSIANYAVNRGGEYEGVRQSLYDFQTYGSAGATSFTFFQVPQGQSSKTLDDTNLEVAGSLPAPKHFLVQSIEILFFPGVNPVTVANGTGTDATASNFTNDAYAIEQAGNLDFFIGSKSYLQEAPIGRFPPKTCLKTEFASAYQMKQAVAADESSQVNMDYGVFSGRPYFVNPWILLVPTQNFNVKLNFNTAVALPSGQDARIGIVLDGILYRLSQ